MGYKTGCLTLETPVQCEDKPEGGSSLTAVSKPGEDQLSGGPASMVSPAPAHL